MNAYPRPADPSEAPDVVGGYATKIRTHLETFPTLALTVPELRAALKLSDRIVRMGLDRLVFCREVKVSYRKPDQKRRGSKFREYQALPRQ